MIAAPGTEHPAPGAEHPAPGTEHPAPSTQHPFVPRRRLENGHWMTIFCWAARRRLALPEPDRNLPRRERAYVAPTTDLERVLADIWAEVLNIVQVGKRDNFFAELGGHSLLGTQLIARVQSALRISVPLRRLFESPTVETFAAALRQDPVLP